MHQEAFSNLAEIKWKKSWIYSLQGDLAGNSKAKQNLSKLANA
jgi:hypothetical protein